MSNDVSIAQNEQDPYKKRLLHLKENNTSTCDTLRQQVVKSTKRLNKNLTQKSFYKQYLLKRVPIIQWLFIEYNFKRFLLADLISGFTVGIMNIPQGMAYALLAHLAPVNGLYISFFPLLIYTLFGSSKQLAIGAIAVVSLLTGEVVLQMSDDYKTSLNTLNLTANATDILVNRYKVTVACSLASLVGLIQIAMGFTGLGVITKYFSDSFISGYTCGSAIHVLTSQIKDLFGLKGLTSYNGSFKIPRTLFNMMLKATSTNFCALISSICCIIYLILFKEYLNPRIKRRFKVEFPSELLLVISMTLISYFAQLNTTFGLDIVKVIPRGLPEPVAPDISLWSSFIKNALLIAIISFSINISLGTLFSRKHNYKLDSTQELYAYGSANIFGSFFSCFPCAASLSRSMVFDNTGGKSQLAALTGSLVIIVVIIWLGPFFEPLPKACLASIIAVALKGLLFQLKDFFNLWKINKYEAICWLGTFLGVVLLDVDIGLFIGVFLSILLIVIKDQRADMRLLVNYDGSYVDNLVLKGNFDESSVQRQNLKIIKCQNSLYFVNISSFLNEFNKLTGYESRISHNKVHTEDYSTIIKSELVILLDLSAVNYVDSSAIKGILQLLEDYEKLDVNVFICSPQESFIQIVNKMNLIQKFETKLFLTLNDALLFISNSTKSVIL